MSKTSEMLALRYSVPGMIQTLKGNGCLLFVDAAQKLKKHSKVWMGQIVQMGLGMYLEIKNFNILLILEVFFKV